MNQQTFQERELSILRSAVDKIEKNTGYTLINNPSVKTIIEIVEQFLRDKKRICYGGTAINNILPLKDQFYDKKVELPDYDFYSPDPMKDAKELADIYYKKGFEEVEAKAGMHPGTFKVFVNYMPVADITYLIDDIYKNIKKRAIIVDGIYYTPANYLRMSMYLELSRPNGDVSRWEKVLKRLSLLNKHYPLKGRRCDREEIQRLFEYGVKNPISSSKSKSSDKSRDSLNSQDSSYGDSIFITVRDSLIAQGCVFFGAYANRMVLKQHPKIKHIPVDKIPDFDVLSIEPRNTARIIKERLTDMGIKKIKIQKRNGVGEIIAPHYEIKVGKETIAFIYEPLACHSYNEIKFGSKTVRIATIDTMLSFYLAFAYVKRPYYNENRIICMSEYLFDVQQKNRLTQKGLLKRFTIDCYGEQLTMEKMRADKSDKYKELKKNRNSKEFDWYFLRYIPAQVNEFKKVKDKSTKKMATSTSKKTAKKRKGKAKKTRKSTNKRPTLLSLFK
tara:strand:- start:15019 stop:16524 length:1506 start_codon:yes stop_codon:yes gene_type:complete